MFKHPELFRKKHFDAKENEHASVYVDFLQSLNLHTKSLD